MNVFSYRQRFSHKGLRSLLMAINVTDPKDSSVVIESDYLHPPRLHIQRVSTNPIEQFTRVRRDLINQNNVYTFWVLGEQSVIQGVSWLIQPENESIFKKFGLGEENGVQFHYFDIDNLLYEDLSSVQCELIDKDELFRSSMQSISYSSALIQRFILKGELPNVGVMEIPVELFINS